MAQIVQTPFKSAPQAGVVFSAETAKKLEQAIRGALEYARFMYLAKSPCSSESAVA
jgi:hypothetical protein